MMMIEDNPAPGKNGKPGKATNLQVMDVMLEWANKSIKPPKTQSCEYKKDRDDDHGHDDDPHHH